MVVRLDSACSYSTSKNPVRVNAKRPGQRLWDCTGRLLFSLIGGLTTQIVVALCELILPQCLLACNELRHTPNPNCFLASGVVK